MYPGGSEPGDPGRDLSFKPKSDADYEAIIRGGVQRRSRRHERLVNRVAELLTAGGAAVVAGHPIDIRVTTPVHMIFEAKLVGPRRAIFAVREAVGQLLEYRHFLKLRDARLCILLDQEPDEPLVHYVENVLGMLMVWLDGTGIHPGPKTGEELRVSGIDCSKLRPQWR